MADLTGRPEDLASALVKMSAENFQPLPAPAVCRFLLFPSTGGGAGQDTAGVGPAQKGEHKRDEKLSPKGASHLIKAAGQGVENG
jgi:hypothetical protein